MTEENYLAHYGILRRSGRYPWGSGANPAQRSKDFFSTLDKLRKEGMTDTEIAKYLSTDEHPFTTTDLRIANTIARNAKKSAEIAQAQKLKDEGNSNTEIGRIMGKNESTVRSLLAPGQKEKVDILKATADMLRRQVDEKGVIDVGKGVENLLRISKEKLATAVSILKGEGYEVFPVQIDQQGTQNKTVVKILAKPGTTYKDVVSDKSMIKSISETSENGGRSWYGLLPPVSVSSKRLKVVYAEDGGGSLDGVIYVRPGKEDLSLGGARYAQVRIMVDGSHYIKGMAMYKEDLPPGVDLMFHTNKKKADLGTNKLKALKAVKTDMLGNIDEDNPFGAVVKQIGPRNEKDELIEVTSAMNLVNKEGDWDKWRNTISTQVLSKQDRSLAKGQLDMTYDRSKMQFDEIMALTNPTVKKKMLLDFAEEADAAAIHLKAAALPRQRSQVILPINSLKETEIYAPNYRNGERVALIRYPHGGKFEIPELVVNNRHPEARSMLGQAQDAVAINSKVAERLSGADFDGDSVLVIPNPITNPKLKTQPPLKDLMEFDPQRDYKPYDGMKTIDGGTWDAAEGKVVYPPGKSPNGRTKQTQMGLVSNLITDMTIAGASNREIASAVKHSMVVIDAEKHGLDYKRSAVENGIPNLMQKYQGRRGGGSSTLISRATARQDVPVRKPRSMAKGGPIDRATGKKIFEETGDSYVDPRTGKVVKKTQRSVKLAETDDAHTLVSKDGGHPIEKVYADHSNRMKALANQARKVAVNTEGIVRSPSAAKAFSKEVESLTSKLRIAEENAPRERHAQVLAGTIITQKRQAAPDMDSTQLKRVKAQALDEARRRTGAKKQLVDITDDEWKAIQAGAISNTRLKRILDNAEPKRVKALATPKTQLAMTPSKIARAKQMAGNNYTQAEIADALGVSLTTLKKEL
jgi:DNA-binding CsgD family transcriptional regulator